MVIYPTSIKKEIKKNTDKEIVTITVTDTSKKSTNKSVDIVVVVMLEVLGEKMMLVLYRLLLGIIVIGYWHLLLSSHCLLLVGKGRNRT